MKKLFLAMAALATVLISCQSDRSTGPADLARSQYYSKTSVGDLYWRDIR